MNYYKDEEPLFFAEQVRNTLDLSPSQPIHVSRVELPDSVACAVFCSDDVLMVLVDEQKPLSGHHAQQLLTEVKYQGGLLGLTLLTL